MIPSRYRFIIILGILLAGSVPATHALLYLQDVDISPSVEDLPPMTSMNVTASVEIVPSGATTFSGGHTLILSTDLDHAGWDVQIFVDGIRGAVIPKGGNYVFVNGFLLSYPTSRDVSVKIALEGAVPAKQEGTQFVVIRVAELNNQNKIVAGSEQIVTRFIVEPGSARTTPVPSGTGVMEKEATTSTTRAASTGISAIAGLIIGFIVLIVRSS